MNRIYNLVIILFTTVAAVAQTGANYDIRYHRLEWTVNPDEYFIEGVITTHFVTTQANVSEITFDLSTPLEVQKVLYGNTEIPFTHFTDLLTITLPNSLVLNTLDSVTVIYKGTPADHGFGSFTKDYHNGQPIVWTLSEPYGARDWWPCKQDLSDKIDSIDVWVTAPTGNKVASNGVLISETELSQTGQVLVHWQHKHAVASYLIAIAVTNYAEYSDFVDMPDGSRLEILNYVYPEDLTLAKAQTPNLIPIIELYNNLFMPYPFANEKYGHAQFGWGGGMEHQTMSFMGDFSKMLMGHELAHQWFGNYITCGSWSHIWLNEGFATYLEGITCEHGLGDQAWDEWLHQKVNYVLSLPEGALFVSDTGSVGRVFSGRLSYAKGAMVLHMLRKQVGDDYFFASVKHYLADEKLANGYAYTKDLQAHFEIISGRDLTDYFADWVYGQGYPTFRLQWKPNNEGVEVRLSQSSSHSSVDFFEMRIPVRVYGSTQMADIYLEHTENGQVFSVPLSFIPKELVLVPERDMLVRGTVVSIDNEQTEMDKLRFGPNPFKENLAIYNDSDTIFDTLEIINTAGKPVRQYGSLAKNSSIHLNLPELSVGVYLLRVKRGNEYFVKTIIKEYTFK